MDTTLQVRLLGSFSVAHGETPVTSISSGRLQLLFAYLILHRDTPRSRQQIAFQFWPDSTEAQARTNLRQLVYNLRQALPDADRYLQMDAQVLQWREDAPCSVDVFNFKGAVQRAEEAGRRGDDRERVVALETAAACYQGDLLPGHYDEWLLSERDRLRDQYAGVLEQLVHRHEEQGEYPAAIQHTRALLRHDPLHEAAYRDLIRLHSLNHDRASALRTYEECVTVLRRELGVDPDPATETVYAQIQQAEAPPSTDREMATPSSTPPLFGRDEEWEHLLASYHAAMAGHPRITLITGEAGIGKTRLAEELLLWARHNGVASARARSYSTEGRLAYGPVTDWLRSPGVYPTLSQVDPIWRTEVARLLPELLAEHPELPHPDPIREGWQRQRLFDALARAMVGTIQPLLLLIDDLQWSDQDTLEWLHYLLRFDSEARVLVVGTVRSEEMRPRDPLQALIHELRRDDLLTELPLGPLGSEATRQLARHLTGSDVEEGAASRLYRNTEGNPLFIVETVRAGNSAWTRGDDPGSDSSTSVDVAVNASIPLPPRVHEVIRARFAQLSPAAQDIAGLAATVGRAFTSAVLAEASEDDEDEVMDALDELWQRQIIKEQPDGLFDFSHERIREVAYVEISPVRRALLHRRVARALEHIHSENLSPVSAQLAAHYERAGMLDEAIEYYQRAAEVAQNVYAHNDAISLLRRAIAALLRLPEGPARDARELELQIALISSLNALKTFDVPNTGETYGIEIDQVALSVQGLSQRLSVPPDSRVLRARALVLITRGQPRPALELGEQLLDIARNAGNDPVLYTEAHYVIGATNDWLGQRVTARKHFEEALRFYDRQRHRIHAVQYGLDPGVACQCRLAYTLLHLGYPEQAAQCNRESLASARELSHPQSLIYSLNRGAWISLELDDLETTRVLDTSAIEMSVEQQVRNWQQISHAILGWLQVREYRDRAGITDIRQGISDDYATGQLVHATYALTLLADAYRQLEAQDEGLAAVAEGLAVVEQTEMRFIEAELYRLKGELLLLQGARESEAEAAFRQALDVSRHQQARLLELRAATGLTRLLRDQGRGDEGLQMLQAIYDWFTEGFDTPDLREAKNILRDLGA